MRKLFITLSIITTALFSSSCDSYLDKEPQGKIIPKSVAEYRALLTSAYNTYPRHKSLSTARTDEVELYMDFNDGYLEYKDNYIYNDAPSTDKIRAQFPYDQFYKVIFYANQTVNEGVKTMEEGADKNQLLAEAYGLRAYSYFDLANLYAQMYDSSTASNQPGVVIENEIQIEQSKPKSSLEQVYNQINADLDKAISLSTVENWNTGMNYRFSKVALYSLKARVNLYQKNYEQALIWTNKALQIKSQLQDLNQNANSVADFTAVESILALEETTVSNLQSSVIASQELLAAFNEGDLRFEMTLDNVSRGYVIKKTINSHYKVSFRTAELYFIKAEALANTQELAQAKEVLQQVIKSRYTPFEASNIISQIQGADLNRFMSFIIDQRFVEFAFEGHRWFDLRRLNQKQIDHPYQGKIYSLQENDPRYTLPFPLSAKQKNPHL